MATSRKEDANSETLVLPQPLAQVGGQAGRGRDTAIADVCERYFRAVTARDVDGVLELMTSQHGSQLRQMRQWPDFCAFFQLWCEAHGQLRRVITSCAEADTAAALLDVESEVVRISLRHVDGKWLIDSEQSETRR